MKITWRITPAGAHIAHDSDSEQDVGNVYVLGTGQIEAYPWAKGLGARGIVTSFNAGREYVERELGVKQGFNEPMYCPFCGGHSINFVTGWSGLKSDDDPDKVIDLDEYQCGPCALSFWS